MRDFVTDAYTLFVSPSRDFDKTAYLFTKDFGKIEVRVVSGRKPLSKFSPHLEPMKRVTIRLAKRSGFTLTDVLTDTICPLARENKKVWSSAMRSLSLIYSLAPREMSDDRLWNILEHMNKTGIIKPEEILSCLGFDSRHAVCGVCGEQLLVGFDIYSHVFLCGACIGEIPDSRVVIL